MLHRYCYNKCYFVSGRYSTDRKTATRAMPQDVEMVPGESYTAWMPLIVRGKMEVLRRQQLGSENTSEEKSEEVSQDESIAEGKALYVVDWSGGELDSSAVVAEAEEARVAAVVSWEAEGSAHAERPPCEQDLAAISAPAISRPVDQVAGLDCVVPVVHNELLNATLTKGALLRLCAKAGVVVVSGRVFPKIREVSYNFILELMRVATTMSHAADRTPERWCGEGGQEADLGRGTRWSRGILAPDLYGGLDGDACHGNVGHGRVLPTTAVYGGGVMREFTWTQMHVVVGKQVDGEFDWAAAARDEVRISIHLDDEDDENDDEEEEDDDDDEDESDDDAEGEDDKEGDKEDDEEKETSMSGEAVITVQAAFLESLTCVRAEQGHGNQRHVRILPQEVDWKKKLLKGQKKQPWPKGETKNRTKGKSPPYHENQFIRFEPFSRLVHSIAQEISEKWGSGRVEGGGASLPTFVGPLAIKVNTNVAFLAALRCVGISRLKCLVTFCCFHTIADTRPLFSLPSAPLPPSFFLHRLYWRSCRLS